MDASASLFVSGAWSEGRGDVFSTVSPSDGRPLWSGRAASAADVTAAIEAARAAFPGWAGRPQADREAVLRRFAELLSAERQALAGIISDETGKPPWESATEVQSMIDKIPLSVAAHAERCRDFRGGPAITRFRPHGVVAVLGPYNFPGHLPNGHIAPALLAGNAVVFKPSELTPLTAQRTVEVWERAGLPAGVLNLVQGGRDTGTSLAGHGGLDGLFFTGSARTGAQLSRLLADQPGRILALETGGNNPLVVHEVRDAHGAALLAVMSAYLSAGQRCTCARRLIVVEGPGGDGFLDALLDAIGRIRVGTPDERPEPFMGPVITASAAEQLLHVHDELVRRGGQPLEPMRLLRPGTGLLAPALVDVTAIPDRADEEYFGPLLQLIRVPDFESAIAEANRTRYGLAAGLLSDDRASWDAFLTRARAGVVNWNRPLTGASGAAPFGGIGESGNHRPSGYFAADYCSYPVASLEAQAVEPPAPLPPGLG